MEATRTANRIEDRRFYRLQLIWFRIRHGLVLLSIRNLLLRLGININPYWIEREGLAFCTEPKLRDDPSLYRVEPLDNSQLPALFRSLRWNIESLGTRAGTEYLAVGLYREKELAALMGMRFGEFTSGNLTIPLQPHEACLENMYTYENYRGRNLAPFLRYKCYEFLAAMGKTDCYSVTQYWNSSSLKFKAKLNARHDRLYLYLGLFKRFEKTILLKRYRR